MKQTVSMKENRDFRRLYHRGKSAATPYLVVYAARNRIGSNRLGLTVSVKLGGAVARNRMKRLMREAYRMHEQEFLTGWDIVVVARSRLCGAKCQDAERAIKKAAGVLGLLDASGGKAGAQRKKGN